MIWTRVAQLDDDIPRQGTAIALQTAIHTMDNPITQKHIQHMLARPEMKETQAAMIGGLVDSAVAALEDKQRSERLGTFATQALNGAMTGAMNNATRELPGIIDGVTRSAVGGALDAALNPARQQQLEGTVQMVVSTSVRSAAEGLRDAEVGKALSEAMTRELGPAFKKTMRDDVAPAFIEVLENERFQRALGSTARTLGREFVAGASDAIAERNKQGEGAGLPGLVEQGARLFGSAAWVLILVIVLLLTWIAKLAMDAKRYREEAHRRAALARLLEETAKASEGKPWAGELFNVVRDRLSSEEKAIRESQPPSRWPFRRPPRERHA